MSLFNRSLQTGLYASFTNVFVVLWLADELGSSDEDASGGDVDFVRTSEDHELKDRLLRKYSGYISTLKQEFTKKKKKGKLPKDSRQVLLNWWNVHYKWPYPTVIPLKP